MNHKQNYIKNRINRIHSFFGRIKGFQSLVWIDLVSSVDLMYELRYFSSQTELMNFWQSCKTQQWPWSQPKMDFVLFEDKPSAPIKHCFWCWSQSNLPKLLSSVSRGTDSGNIHHLHPSDPIPPSTSEWFQNICIITQRVMLEPGLNHFLC